MTRTLRGRIRSALAEGRSSTERKVRSANQRVPVLGHKFTSALGHLSTRALSDEGLGRILTAVPAPQSSAIVVSVFFIVTYILGHFPVLSSSRWRLR